VEHTRPVHDLRGGDSGFSGAILVTDIGAHSSSRGFRLTTLGVETVATSMTSGLLVFVALLTCIQ